MCMTARHTYGVSPARQHVRGRFSALRTLLPDLAGTQGPLFPGEGGATGDRVWPEVS